MKVRGGVIGSSILFLFSHIFLKQKSFAGEKLLLFSLEKKLEEGKYRIATFFRSDAGRDDPSSHFMTFTASHDVNRSKSKHELIC